MNGTKFRHIGGLESPETTMANINVNATIRLPQPCYVLFIQATSEDSKNFKYCASAENAGIDVYCAGNAVVAPAVHATEAEGGSSGHLLPLGIRAVLVRIDPSGNFLGPSHYWLLPRSSIFKTGLMMANSMGVIDKGYRGELKAPVYNITSHDVHVAHGTRLFQIVAPEMAPIIIQVTDRLPYENTERGAGGFGSTGGHAVPEAPLANEDSP